MVEDGDDSLGPDSADVVEVDPRDEAAVHVAGAPDAEDFLLHAGESAGLETHSPEAAGEVEQINVREFPDGGEPVEYEPGAKQGNVEDFPVV